MASFGLYQKTEKQECSNCAAVANLALCSRCHTAWFCSVKCQKAYWPFHKAWCHKNDFADAVEKEEPKFARWMRKHAKMAVLKDDEVDRLERKVTSMDDMYGKLNPKPLPPSYDSDDIRRMRAADQLLLEAKRSNSKQELMWKDITVPELLGLTLRDDTVKWRQSQAHVEVFVRLPPGATAQDVHVTLRSTRLEVSISGERVLCGDLAQTVKCDESTWLICDGVLEIVLLKKNRRGQYDNGKTNADTFWFSLLLAPAAAGGAGGSLLEQPTASSDDAALPIEGAPPTPPAIAAAAGRGSNGNGGGSLAAAAEPSTTAVVAAAAVGSERIDVAHVPGAYFSTPHDGPSYKASALRRKKQPATRQQQQSQQGNAAAAVAAADDGNDDEQDDAGRAAAGGGGSSFLFPSASQKALVGQPQTRREA